VVRLVHVLTNKLLKFFSCHSDSLVGHKKKQRADLAR
jgi:hypothetical protein